jgi:AcrR family transcriptional regulator
MARVRAETRQTIVDSAYALFYKHGFARVGVDQIAAKAGITKRTLYDHFESKDALLAAVLDRHNTLALNRIMRWGEKLTDRDLDGMIDSLFADLAAWAGKPRWSGPGFTRLVMELADLPGHPARVIARKHKSAVEGWFAGELSRRRLDHSPELAREIVLLLEGATALMLVHGDTSYALGAAAAAKRLVGAMPKPATAKSRRKRA